MYMPINPLGYSCIKKLQRDNLWHAYNEPINFYSEWDFDVSTLGLLYFPSIFSSKWRLKVKALFADIRDLIDSFELQS